MHVDGRAYFRDYSCVSASLPISTSLFGTGMGPILFDDLNCQGSEESLLMCNYAGVRARNCYRSEEATVICRAGNDISPCH